MKQFMIDMMSLMMPYMKHIMWAGIIVAKVKPEIDTANPSFEILRRYG